jgi:hypothetical protein
VVRFLSPEWLAALGAAVAASDELRRASTGVDLTVRQLVTGGPDGDVSWSLRVSDGTVAVGPGDDGADVVVAQHYATAAAISTGALSPAAAFAAGRIRLGGRVGLQARHGDLVTGLGDVFASLRAATEYPIQEAG